MSKTTEDDAVKTSEGHRGEERGHGPHAQPARPGVRGLRSWGTRLALTAAVCCLPPGPILRVDDTAAGVSDARAVLDNWVQTRRILSQEQRDWDLGRETLVDRTELVQREIESLRGRIGDAQTSIGEAEKKLADLQARNGALADAASGLRDTVAQMESRTQDLLARLPEPIRARVRPLSQRFPDSAAETGLSLSERFQNVIGVLNEVNKFQRDVTATSEVRTLGDGGTAEVTAVYLGVATGWYATARGDAAGVGSGGPEGWTWRPIDEAAPAVAAVVAIMKNEQPAAFVPLPITVD
jgi:hypothetical protein